MPFDPVENSPRLARLPSEYYCGRAFVHWTMTLDSRATGWLDEVMHGRIREWMCHALGREQVVCPVYCLMPDHAHFLWIGCRETSDQSRAAVLFRRAWNGALRRRGFALQRQAYDHVLRESERARGAFVATAQYVLENPVRAGLVEQWQEYLSSGALVPGYPQLDPREPDFWARFWKIYEHLAVAGD
jgi:REP element-mobilizing transposase RayT